MKNRVMSAALIALVVGTTGCGTIMNFKYQRPPLPFGGVLTDVAGAFAGVGHGHGERLLLLDVPFSLAADAATLPVTVPWTLLVGRSR